MSYTKQYILSKLNPPPGIRYTQQLLDEDQARKDIEKRRREAAMAEKDRLEAEAKEKEFEKKKSFFRKIMKSGSQQENAPREVKFMNENSSVLGKLSHNYLNSHRV